MIDDDELDGLVRGFARLLSSSWAEVQAAARLSHTGSYVRDWMQANWEMLVEGVLPPDEVFLEVYGEGADCNTRSSRVYRPDVLPTHTIACVARADTGVVTDRLSGEEVRLGPDGLAFEELATQSERWYEIGPPFDCALLRNDGVAYLLRTDEVVFVLRPVAEVGAWKSA